MFGASFGGLPVERGQAGCLTGHPRCSRIVGDFWLLGPRGLRVGYFPAGMATSAFPLARDLL